MNQCKYRKEKKNRWMRYICICLMLGMVMMGTACGKEIQIPTYDEEPDPVKKMQVFAIVRQIDEVNGKISLRAVSYDTDYELSFSGGVDVKDQYGEILAISQVKLGSVVDAVYDSNRDKLLSLQISDNEKVRILSNVSGVEIDSLEKEIKMNGSVYKMQSNTSAFSDNNEIGLNEICSEDELTVWLYNDVICSMYVELGHGYVRLADYAGYIGGTVEIGYDVIVPVTEDMLLTVREGEYTLRIRNGENAGEKTIQVVKNQEVEISLADLIIEPQKMGSILFRLTPSNATVYIDGKKVNTEGAVSIPYGKHKILITAQGYENYSASFNVNYAYKEKEYVLNVANESTEQDNKKNSSESTTQQTTKTEATTETQTTEKGSTDQKVNVAAPIGASVYLDGKYIGVAPISFTKVIGSHIITLSMSGCLSKSYTEVFVDDSKDVELKYDNLATISSLIE